LAAYDAREEAEAHAKAEERAVDINNAQTGLRIFGFVVLVAGMVASIPILVEPWREFFVKITG
jgi:hypothetical protein